MSRNRKARVNDSAPKKMTPKQREQRAEEVRTILREYLEEDGPGVAVLVIVNDEPVLSEGYGQARIGPRSQKITPDTVFDLGSISKHFTALGILMLIDQTTTGKRPRGGNYDRLYFDTTLRSILTELPPWADNINLRNLLNHSSGILDYFDLWLTDEKIASWLTEINITAGEYYDKMKEATGYWYEAMPGYDKVMNRERYLTNQMMLNLLSKQPESGEPRREWAYSNTGYAVLAEVIRRATGKSLREFLKEEVFDRLEMNDTFVYDDEVPGYRRHALGYRHPPVSGKYESIDSDTIFNYIHGDGNIHSTINDLAKWIKAWNEIDDPEKPDPKKNNPDIHKKEKLIKTSTFLKVYRPGLNQEGEERRSLRRRRDFGRGIRNYASGMMLYRYKNKNVNSYALYHGGNWLGFNSYLLRGNVAVYRQKDVYEVTVVLLTNYLPLDDERWPPSLCKKIARIYWPPHLKDRYNVIDYIDRRTRKSDTT